jgi:2-polyprenyl-3-methyl-5-hydroxy-6-metoxy-1,4-benzoquinol methylase
MPEKLSDEKMYFHDDPELGVVRNDQDKENVERHIARYKFAKKFISKDDIALDCACGCGYGSKILSEVAKSVIAVDIDETAIKYAKKYYNADNIQYIQKDCYKLEFEDCSFDKIVSIETIEHLPDPVPFIKKIYKLLKKGGIVIISTPMLRYKDGKPYITSPYHLSEMPREQFLRLIKSIFDEASFYAQHQTEFPELTYENTGFCIAVCKKK